MNARATYLNGIREIRRTVRMQLLKRFFEHAAAVFLLFFTVYRGIRWIGETAMLPGPGVLYAAAGLALAAAAVAAWAGKKPLVQRLIEIDARCGLQDRLSTAYEYLQKAPQTEFFDLLVRDAGQKISQIDKSVIFPKKLSRIHVAMGLLILANALMAVVTPPLDAESQGEVGAETLNEIRTVIRQYTTASPAKASRTEKRAAGRIERQMADMSDILENPPVQRKPLASAVSTALREIRGDKIARARGLVAELGLDGVESVAVRQIRQADHLTHFQLKKLNELIEHMFDGQVPEAVARDLAVLDEHHRLTAYLEQILDGLEQGTVQASAPEKDPPDDSAGPVSGRNPAAEHRSDGQPQAATEKAADSDRRAPSAGDDRSRSGAEETPAERAEDELGNGPSSAGRHGSDAPAGEPYSPDRRGGPASRDNTASARGAEISVLIRSLTATGTAKLETERIVRDYRQSVEGILQKEDIPLNRRTTIRNYFLSIGLRKDTPSSDRTQ